MVVLSGFLPLHSLLSAFREALCIFLEVCRGAILPWVDWRWFLLWGVGYLEVASWSLSLFPFSGLPYGAGLFLRFLLGLLSLSDSAPSHPQHLHPIHYHS